MKAEHKAFQRWRTADCACFRSLGSMAQPEDRLLIIDTSWLVTKGMTVGPSDVAAWSSLVEVRLDAQKQVVDPSQVFLVCRKEFSPFCIAFSQQSRRQFMETCPYLVVCFVHNLFPLPKNEEDCVSECLQLNSTCTCLDKPIDSSTAASLKDEKRAMESTQRVR